MEDFTICKRCGDSIESEDNGISKDECSLCRSDRVKVRIHYLGDNKSNYLLENKKIEATV